MVLNNDLDKAQAQILNEDLSDNPYLQASPIPSLDNELKTEEKTIIPALNKFNKEIIAIKDTMKGFTTELNNNFEDLEKGLKSYIDKNIEESVEDNTDKIAVLEEKINQLEKSIGAGVGTGTGTGGEEMKLVYVGKKELKDESENERLITAPFKIDELLDLNRQIIVTSKVDRLFGAPLRECNVLLMKPFYTSSFNEPEDQDQAPVEISVVPETGEINLAVTRDRAELTVYFYKFE